jgi:KaiC/GvpD/RAD55 family RecA-like ATPase
VVLVAGPSGALKTTMCLQMAARHRADGVSALYVTLEEPRESLVRILERLGLGEKGDFIVDVGRLRLEHESAHGARNWFAILRDYLAGRMEKDPSAILVLDSLNSLYALSDMERPRHELFDFFSFLRSLGTTTLLTFESDGEILFKHHEDALADGTFLLSFGNSGGHVDLQLRCAKMRHTAHSRDAFHLTIEGGRLVARPVDPAQ